MESKSNAAHNMFQNTDDDGSFEVKTTPSFYAIVRHGERGNAVPGFVFKNKFDPPLTPLGIEQATATGKYLKEFFEQKGWSFDNIIIESSPFLRSMQTAAWVAHELDITDIVINYQISENITTTDPGCKALDWHFKENPMPNLEYTKSHCDFAQMKQQSPEYDTEEFFPSSNINFVDKQCAENEQERELIYKAFPEKDKDVFRRALRIAESATNTLKQQIASTTASNSHQELDDKQASVCLLQFSHGQFIDSMAHLCDDDEDQKKGKPESAKLDKLDSLTDKDREHVVNFLKNVKYGFPTMCSFSGFSTFDVNSNERQSEFTNFCEHVKKHLRNQ